MNICPCDTIFEWNIRLKLKYSVSSQIENVRSCGNPSCNMPRDVICRKEHLFVEVRCPLHTNLPKKVTGI